MAEEFYKVCGEKMAILDQQRADLATEQVVLDQERANLATKQVVLAHRRADLATTKAVLEKVMGLGELTI